MGSWTRIARRARVPLGFVFAVLYLWLARPSPMSLLAGAMVAIPGLWLRAVASGHVRKNEVLTTTGPYAYTRNPLYLGSLITAVGFALMARSWWIIAAVAVFFVGIYVPVIRGEEAYLREHFPEFESYARQVPMLVPRWRSNQAEGTFSWALYRQHREYNALLGALGVTALLVGKMVWLR
jgi:protein-S-isoprenylcysteine O-methyltransferase Ste14